MARMLIDAGFQAALGVPVVVDNRGGGSTMIGSEHVAKSPPDGHTLLFTTSVLVVGKLLPPSLYSSGNSMAAMVGFGIGPILGAGAGGFVYDRLGSTTLFVGSSVVALLGGVAALVALRTPELDTPLEEPLPRDEEFAPEPGRL
jgi:MFS family permease